MINTTLKLSITGSPNRKLPLKYILLQSKSSANWIINHNSFWNPINYQLLVIYRFWNLNTIINWPFYHMENTSILDRCWQKMSSKLMNKENTATNIDPIIRPSGTLYMISRSTILQKNRNSIKSRSFLNKTKSNIHRSYNTAEVHTTDPP